MAADRRKREPDSERIDVNQEHELRDWAKKFSVTEDELREAVHAVGDRAEAVRDHLGKVN